MSLISPATFIERAFATTSNLAGTTLNNGGSLNASSTGIITLQNSSGFTGGYFRIENEIIAYNLSGATGQQINITARGQFGTDDDSHDDLLSVGQLYDSGVLTLDRWSQVITKIECDQNCALRFVWYTTPTATTQIRALTPGYVAASGYDFLSSVAFGPYVRYTIAPSGGVTTTRLFFETEFSRTALHPQLFTLNSGVFGSMVAQLTRSVLVGQQEGTTTFANTSLTAANELLTNTQASNRKSRAVYSAAAVAATAYVVMVDVSDTTNFPHSQTGQINVDHFSASVSFASGTAKAVVSLGIITRIDGTNADISYLISDVVGVQSANDSMEITHNYQPSAVVFKQSGGSLVGAVTSVVDNAVAAVNTGASLASSRGVIITPALGDVVLKLEYDNDNFDVTAAILYHSTA